MMLKQLKRMGLLVLTCLCYQPLYYICVRLQNRTGHLIPAASQKQVLLWIWTRSRFFAQNIHVQKYPPASITKLLTALVVVENASMDDQVTFSHDAVYNVEDGSGK